jgi:hypothetical protein
MKGGGAAKEGRCNCNRAPLMLQSATKAANDGSHYSNNPPSELQTTAASLARGAMVLQCASSPTNCTCDSVARLCQQMMPIFAYGGFLEFLRGRGWCMTSSAQSAGSMAARRRRSAEQHLLRQRWCLQFLEVRGIFPPCSFRVRGWPLVSTGESSTISLSITSILDVCPPKLYLFWYTGHPYHILGSNL